MENELPPSPYSQPFPPRPSAPPREAARRPWWKSLSPEPGADHADRDSAAFDPADADVEDGDAALPRA
jgi:hypothetical protein